MRSDCACTGVTPFTSAKSVSQMAEVAQVLAVRFALDLKGMV